MTLALTLAPSGVSQPKPASLPVTLPFNLDAFTTDGKRTNGNFDAGYTYPAELMPASIVRDGITFQLGPTNDGAFNALSCQGQTISLNGSGYDHLYLLAAAASNATTGTFTVNPGEVQTNLTVQYFTGFIGQWIPPSVISDEVAWVCTHRHDSTGANNAYNFCYLFKYRIDLPPNATSLVLPNAPNLRIFAMTLTTNTTPETVPAGGPLAANQLPWAEAGPDRLANAGPGGAAMVTLDASASSDPDGVIVSYAWSTNGVSLATGVQPTVTLPLGTNVVQLTVTDNQGGTSQDAVTVTVLPPLNVTLTASTNRGSAPLTVQFTGSATGALTNLTSPDTTDDHLGTITARGENTGGGEIAVNAFDNNTATKWLDFSTNANFASWIQYQYASGLRYAVTNYTITSANDAPERDPSAWRLLASNDGGATWATLDARTNQAFSARFQKLTFSTTNTNVYNIYRLQIDSVYNPSAANSVQLSEIELLGSGIPGYVYAWSFGDGAVSTAQNPQHTFTINGNYQVMLAVSSGLQTGTNSLVITVGPPLTATLAASPATGAAPLSVQFTAQTAGGNIARAPYDTTDAGQGTITAQGDHPANETMAKAFDNDPATKWLDYANAFPSTRSSWIQYQYAGGSQFVVSQYTITSGNDAASYPERSPKNWRLLASNDGASWATLDTRINQVFTGSKQKFVYPVANTAAYNIYRFQIDCVSNPPTANSMQLDELEFIGLPACTYSWSFGDGATSTAQNPQHLYTSNGTYTVTVVVSDGVALATNSMTVSALPLALAAVLPDTSRLVLSWPSWASNVSLYAATNLGSPVQWLPVTNPISNQNGTNTVTVTIDPGNCFFQLRSQ
jgi:PKD repeat protein